MIAKQKILIVDDKKRNLIALRQVLAGLDVEVIEAANGNEALAATLEHRFAVAILDVMMPGMDGYELAEYLRSDARTRSLPIIFLTAVYSAEERIFKGYEVGAVDYIIKPYNRDVLLSKVRVFLELEQIRAQLDEKNELLEQRVQQRTAELCKALEDLQSEIDQRQEAEFRRRQAELEVLAATEREQQRIGRNLHDSIQGGLAGLVMMLEVLKTSAKPDALIDELIGVTRELIRQTRELARSLCPVDLAGEGLPKALEQLAMTTSSLFRVHCDWHCGATPELPDATTSSHLYYISCEAVNNALKHAQSERIVISLQGGSDGLTLSIEDDGIGLPADPPAGGMGLRTMGYRASAIGAVLSIRRARKAGTIVECYWPYRNAAMKLKSEVQANATR